VANDDGTAARAFHEATKHSAESVNRGPHVLDWDNMPVPFKIYRGIPGETLPRSLGAGRKAVLEAICGSVSSRPAGELPDRAALGRLLYYSLGIVRRRPSGSGHWHYFRAAPCTGALYHVDAYLVCAELPDLTAGVYHFGPHDFSLRRLRSGDWRAAVVEACGGAEAAAHAPVTLVLASTYWRNAWKYRARAYRHVFWDGGTALAQLLAQAAADGWCARVLLGFSDRAIERLCGLDSAREGTIALVPIGEGPRVSPPAEAADPPAIRLATEPLSAHEPDYPEIRAVHEAGRLEDGGRADAWRARAPLPAVAAPSAPLVSLAQPHAVIADPLEEVILRRGSTRTFARQAIGGDVLADMLVAASAPLSADYRACEARPLVDLYAIINSVDGVAPGAYRWRREASALEPLSAGERRREAGYLALGQALGADAAVDVYAIADLEAVLSALGTRGYRAATLEGGIAGGRLYLAAYGRRIGATGLTFFDDDVTRFFGLDPGRFGVMFLASAGVAARLRSRA
jgi:SagB-type dehydrogenase family enzyme